jgi:hypothetical protein
MSLSFISNYGGRQANNSAYIKTFFPGLPPQLWMLDVLSEANNEIVIKPAGSYSDVFIPNNLYIGGSIITISDRSKKMNINDLQNSENIMKLKPKSYTYKNDIKEKTHFGFIAQELQEVFPELVVETIDMENKDTKETIKNINYLEIIPLLVSKIQQMQKEIDNLKENINNLQNK